MLYIIKIQNKKIRKKTLKPIVLFILFYWLEFIFSFSGLCEIPNWYLQGKFLVQFFLFFPLQNKSKEYQFWAIAF